MAIFTLDIRVWLDVDLLSIFHTKKRLGHAGDIVNSEFS